MVFILNKIYNVINENDMKNVKNKKQVLISKCHTLSRSGVFCKRTLKQIAMLSQELWKTKSTTFYHPNHLNTRCVIESTNS